MSDLWRFPVKSFGGERVRRAFVGPFGLLGDRPKRFNQLRKSVDGLSQKVLTQILRGLETDGLVTRTAFPTVPVTVEYALTPLGDSLRTTLDGVRLWAEANIEAILQARKAKGP